MRFTLSFGIDNAAYRLDADEVSAEEYEQFRDGMEVAETLRKIADKVDESQLMASTRVERILDANGNHVGDWTVTDELLAFFRRREFQALSDDSRQFIEGVLTSVLTSSHEQYPDANAVMADIARVAADMAGITPDE